MPTSESHQSNSFLGIPGWINIASQLEMLCTHRLIYMIHEEMLTRISILFFCLTQAESEIEKCTSHFGQISKIKMTDPVSKARRIPKYKVRSLATNRRIPILLSYIHLHMCARHIAACTQSSALRRIDS
jgi:hypothetical protein